MSIPRICAAVFVVFAGFLAPSIWPHADWGTAAWFCLAVTTAFDILRDR